ncbi:MAG: hypothetical protein JWN52_6565 [Actinomycetia bacterium]|nr:hypothetical protein [Actinomycetes bacterium]
MNAQLSFWGGLEPMVARGANPGTIMVGTAPGGAAFRGGPRGVPFRAQCCAWLYRWPAHPKRDDDAATIHQITESGAIGEQSVLP